MRGSLLVVISSDSEIWIFSVSCFLIAQRWGSDWHGRGKAGQQDDGLHHLRRVPLPLHRPVQWEKRDVHQGAARSAVTQHRLPINGKGDEE